MAELSGLFYYPSFPSDSSQYPGLPISLHNSNLYLSIMIDFRNNGLIKSSKRRYTIIPLGTKDRSDQVLGPTNTLPIDWEKVQPFTSVGDGPGFKNPRS